MVLPKPLDGLSPSLSLARSLALSHQPLAVPTLSAHIHARIYMRDIGDRTRDNRRAGRRVVRSRIARLSGVLVCPEGVTSGVARQW